jgi:low temperature requirement protein LtrA
MSGTDVGATEQVERGRVTALELFFDLVFVFAITQVTSLLAADPTWRGLGHGMLVLAALWWAWASYAWLTNSVDPEEGVARLVIFAAMAAMLVASLATPRAFAGDGLLFGVAYALVRVLHLALYSRVAGDAGVRTVVRRLAPTALTASALLVAAGAIGGSARTPLWVLALAVDYGGLLLIGVRGWQVAPAHFAERHGLIIIIALGESIVAVGVGLGGGGLSAGVVTAAVLGVAVAAALWWSYFDVVALVAERTLRGLEGDARNGMARDSYTYLHLPMVAGIVLFALGVKKVVAHVDEPLHTVPAVGLCGGLALYLAALVAFRLRNVRSINRQRTVAAVLLVALIPPATRVDALVALAAVTVLSCGLIAYEAVRFAAARDRVRHAGAIEVSGRR